MSRSLPLVTRAALLLLITVPTSNSAAWSQSGITWEPYSFASPSGAEVAADRGWLTVPESTRDPDGATIRLPVVRLAGRGGSGTPIIWLAGGPGNSGIQAATGGTYPFFERLRAFGDVIVYDQRGTGSAEPSLMVDGRLDLPASASVDSPAAREALVRVADKIRTTMRERDIDLSAYNTEQSIADLDALRQALGAERVILVAHSYGTHLALAYIKRHGAHVERAVLGGVNGLDDRWREPIDGDRWIERVSERIGREGTLGPGYDFTARVRRVLDSFEANPAIVPLDGQQVLLGKSEIQLVVTLRSGDIEFVRSLPVLFTGLEQRTNLDGIARAVQQAVRQRPIGTAMTYAMHVASGVSPEKRRRIEAQQETSLFGNAMNWGIGDDAFVRALGVPDLGEEFRAAFESDVPVLLISATLDGRTSESDARRVGQQFGRATHITLDGASHDFFFRDSTAALLWEPMGAFLRGEGVADQVVTVPIEFARPE